MQNQQYLFDLSEDITYLNGAYMAPQLKSVTQIGIEAVQRKSRPNEILPTDFFTQKEILKKRFAHLISAPDYRNTAIIPSVSYGIANAANNTTVQAGDEIILVDEQFPSNVYIWKEVATKNNAIIKVVPPPKDFHERAKRWNQSILKAITEKTAVVAMAMVHWADGTLFDLKAIRKKTQEIGAKLIIDGTQSIGALPFSVQEIEPDALVCGGYKWLLGPYSIGMAYYNDSFNEGTPIEHNWMNRYNSEDFNNLTQYEDKYQEKAARYSVGESSNFVLTPMMIAAIEQLITWQPSNIQKYCKTITSEAIQKLRTLGCFIEEDMYRAHHLFGIYLPDHMNLAAIKNKLIQEKIFVSYRGNAIRVSCNVYNTKEDFEKLVAQFS